MNTVTGRLRLSGECPAHPKGIVSLGLFAMRPPRPTVVVVSSGDGENTGELRPAEESPGSGQIERSVATETVFKAFRSDLHARFDAMESTLKILRRMIAGAIAPLAVMLILAVKVVLFMDRSSTPLPPPRSSTVRALAGADTFLPTGALLGSEPRTLDVSGSLSRGHEPNAHRRRQGNARSRKLEAT